MGTLPQTRPQFYVGNLNRVSTTFFLLRLPRIPYSRCGEPSTLFVRTMASNLHPQTSTEADDQTAPTTAKSHTTTLAKQKKTKKKKKRKRAVLKPDPSMLDQARSFMYQLPGMITSGAVVTAGYSLQRLQRPSLLRDDWVYVKVNVKDFVHHHWTGLKLLWADTKTAMSLLVRVASGKSLTRRERRQLVRTTSDIFRLVPFSFFIIIPGAELLLPIFLKIFPNMLPSTFNEKLKVEEQMKKQLQARLNMAAFLQETVEEMAMEIKEKSKVDEDGKSGQRVTASKLLDLIENVQDGKQVDVEEFMKLTNIFKDNITLDRLPRAQLVAMCRFMQLRTFGSDSYLRFQLQSKLSQLQRDDQSILWEGLDSLSISELKQACEDRGMRATGMLKKDYQRQLQSWLDLSVKKSVPTSLLILSRAILITTEKATDPEDAVELLKESISALDEEVITDAVLEATEVAASKKDLKEQTIIRELKLESLKIENELIEDEREELQEAIEEKQKRRKEEIIDNAKPLLSTDGGAKVDGFTPEEGAVDPFASASEQDKDQADDTVGQRTSSEDADGDATAVADQDDVVPILTSDKMEALEILSEPSFVQKERQQLDKIKEAVRKERMKEILEDEKENAKMEGGLNEEFDADDYDDDDDFEEEEEDDDDDEEEAGNQSVAERGRSLMESLDPRSTRKDAVSEIHALKGSASDKERKDGDDDENDDDGDDEDDEIKTKEKMVRAARARLAKMTEKLESQVDKVDESIGDKLNLIHVLKLDEETSIVTKEELFAALMHIVGTKENASEIEALVDKLDTNNNGYIDVSEMRGFVEDAQLNDVDSGAQGLQDYIDSFRSESKDNDDGEARSSGHSRTD